MKKSEAKQKVRNGEIQIHNDNDNIRLLEDLLGINWGEWLNNCYSGQTCRPYLYNNTPLVKLSEITEDEEFTKGELVEVRDYDSQNWTEREFIIEYKGRYICVSEHNHYPLSWKQIRKIQKPHPIELLAEQIKSLQQEAKKHNLIVDINIKEK